MTIFNRSNCICNKTTDIISHISINRNFVQEKIFYCSFNNTK